MGEIETTSKCRPILFSGPMVRALLEGRKTMTRRVIKPGLPAAPSFVGRYRPTREDGGELIEGREVFGCHGEDWGRVCPYGGPGDRLRVNETWGTRQWWDSTKPKELPVLPGSPHCEIFFAADGPNKEVKRWRSPFFLPPVASRILLEIKAVRVERLGDISNEDAKAEGVIQETVSKWVHNKCDVTQKAEVTWKETPREAFHRLWESINGPGSWEKNPWVWVVEFERVKP